jgi:hypothetical protein
MTNPNTNGSLAFKDLDQSDKNAIISDRQEAHDSRGADPTPRGSANESNPNDSNKRKAEEYSSNTKEIFADPAKRLKRSEQARGIPSNRNAPNSKASSPRLSHVDSMVAVVSASSKKSEETKKASVSGSEQESPGAFVKIAQNYEIVAEYVDLDPLPSNAKPLPPLSNSDRKELERYLEISKEDNWRDDWIGNLAFADKDISNPDGKSRERSKKSLFRWAERGKVSLRLLNNLLRFVYHLEETPTQAKRILGSAEPDSVRSIQGAVRRVSYDPKVLRQDGWRTAKGSDPIGASGGPFRIGEKVFWEGFEGVVIAYIHDHDLGDLWKAMWLEEFDTFDLEAEELEDAKRRFERKLKQKEQQEQPATSTTQTNKESSSTNKQGVSTDTGRRSGRYASADFQVEGIEHGVVLAVSYSRGARPGLFWPARVMHFTEMKSYGSQNKRGSQKQKVDVVFLAPYWNAPPNMSGGRRAESYSESLSRHGSSIFSSGPLFEVENIDASEESIQEYPYDPERGLDMDQLLTSFKFAGLPKAAFSRFVDSHRLALGLKTYSQKVMESTAATDLDRTTAGLLEAHPIAGQTACFPDALLHLPFAFILSQLPSPTKESSHLPFDDSNSNEEPALQLGIILESMKPPTCWGVGGNVSLPVKASPETTIQSKPFASTPISLKFGSDGAPVTLDRFMSGLSSLSSLLSNTQDESSMSALLAQNLSQLLSKVPCNSAELKNLAIDVKRDRLKALVKLWIVVKVRT